MTTKWWRFIPRLGWDRRSADDAKRLRDHIERDPAKCEGYRVLEVHEAIDPAVIAAMVEPLMIVHPDTLKAMQAMGDMLPRFLSAFPRVTVRESPFAPTDSVFIMDTAFKPKLFPMNW